MLYSFLSEQAYEIAKEAIKEQYSKSKVDLKKSEKTTFILVKEDDFIPEDLKTDLMHEEYIVSEFNKLNK